MPFVKGQSGNAKGKPRGPNKVTVEFRDTVQKLLDRNADNVQKWLAAVAVDNPGKALDLMSKLAEYAAPKLSRTEVTGPNGGDIPHSVTITHVKPEH